LWNAFIKSFSLAKKNYPRILKKNKIFGIRKR
jgi:hypothetical protein